MQNKKRGFTSRRHPELDSGSRCYQYGFTLMELLVVVIIIAVLAAVAVPQYKKAVLKSRFSKVMPVAKAISDAQEVYYLGKNYYANNTEKDVLDITADADTTVELASQTQEDNYNYVAASRSDVPGARYIMYQAHSPRFAGNIHCEADETNADALWLCEKGLGGTEIPGSINQAAGEYKTFLLAGNTGDKKLPTSFAKQVAACEQSTTCTVVQQGETTTLQECEGNLTGTNIKTCTNITYDENGEKKGYERTTQQCGLISGYLTIIGYSNYAQYYSYSNNSCITRTYDESGTQTDYKATQACNGTLVDGKCTVTYWTSGGQLYTNYSDGKWETGGIYIYCLTANNGVCTEWDTQRSFHQFITPNGNGQYSLLNKFCATVNEDGTDCATYR